MRKAWVAAAIVAAGLMTAPAARADDPNTVTVEGTSDVSDSHLMDKVIEPGFEAAYPQYNLLYQAPSGGSGTAISAVRNGTGSGLLVHAASLENQFVADGLSLEPYGRAIFWGDYVILGPADDPAGVLNGSTHNAVEAFKKIASPGVAGHAAFVSRGNTSGTAVQEHTIWQMVDQTYGGVPGRDVLHLAGREPRRRRGAGSRHGGECDNTGEPDLVLGRQQQPGRRTSRAADACNIAGEPSHKCYTFTDRGTFMYQVSQNLINNLKIVGARQRGRRSRRVDAAGQHVPPLRRQPQRQLQPRRAPADQHRGRDGVLELRHLARRPGGDRPVPARRQRPGVHPERGAGADRDVRAGERHRGHAGDRHGQLEERRPRHAGARRQDGHARHAGRTVATGTTDAAGNYSISFTPTASASYTVVHAADHARSSTRRSIPAFGDILQPQSAAVGSSTLQSTIKVDKVTPGYRKATLTGTVLPGTAHKNATVTVLTRKKGSKGAFKVSGSAKVTAGTYSVTTSALKPGSYEFQTRFDDPGVVLPAVAATTIREGARARRR